MQGSALRPMLFLLYIKAATVPLAETQQSLGNNSSETSSPVQDKPTQSSQDGGGWTLVTPRRRKRGWGQGPRVPPPPYFRMPWLHLWPPSIQQKYPQATSSASSASSEVSEDENSPVASRTRARTMQ